jgi:ParB family chromosome partitioning protein
MTVPDETNGENRLASAIDLNGRPRRDRARALRNPPFQAESDSAGRNAPKKRNGHAADDPSTTSPETPTSLAKARIQLAALEETERRLKAELSLLAKKQAASESTLRALGEELGNALAERSAAELDAERLASDRERARDEAAELNKVSAQRLSEWNTERDEQSRAREQLTEALSQLRLELESACAERDEQSRAREQLTEALSQLRLELESACAERDEQSRAREQLTEALSQLRLELESACAKRDEQGSALEQTAATLSKANVELEQAREERKLAQADERRFAAQAIWANQQLVLFLEQETVAAEELARAKKNAEESAERVDTLIGELADARSQSEALDAELRTRACRLIGTDFPETAGLLELFDGVRRRVRELERELDQCRAKRETASALLRPAGSRIRLRFWRWRRPRTE